MWLPRRIAGWIEWIVFQVFFFHEIYGTNNPKRHSTTTLWAIWVCLIEDWSFHLIMHFSYSPCTECSNFYRNVTKIIPFYASKMSKSKAAKPIIYHRGLLVALTLQAFISLCDFSFHEICATLLYLDLTAFFSKSLCFHLKWGAFGWPFSIMKQ